MFESLAKRSNRCSSLRPQACRPVFTCGRARAPRYARLPALRAGFQPAQITPPPGDRDPSLS
eukprot:214447-Prymnesium_polylepis.1